MIGVDLYRSHQAWKRLWRWWCDDVDEKINDIELDDDNDFDYDVEDLNLR